MFFDFCIIGYTRTEDCSQIRQRNKMNSNLAKKILQLDIKNTSTLVRHEKVANLYTNVLRSMKKDLKNNSPMLSSKELDQVNLIQKVAFSRILWVGKKQKKSNTNQDFAENLLGYPKLDTDFLVEDRPDFSIINHDVVNGVQNGFFSQFGLTFKFCPSGVLQRPYRSPKTYIDTEFLEITNNNIEYVATGERQYNDSVGIPTRMESKEYRQMLTREFQQEFQVQISKPFWILDSEITITLFEKVMGYHMNYFSDAKKEKRKRRQTNNELDIEAFDPVENIDWDVAILFCNRLSRMLGFQPCYLDYQGNPILSMREYWELAQIGKCPEFYTWGISPENMKHIAKNEQHIPKEIYELPNLRPNQIKVNFDQSANGFRLPTTSEWIWALGTVPNTDPKKMNVLDNIVGKPKPQSNDQFQICSKRIGRAELCFDFFLEHPTVMCKKQVENKKTKKMETEYGYLWVDTFNMSLLQDTTNKLKKDFYVGNPNQISILDYPNIPKEFISYLKFDLSMVERWTFCCICLDSKGKTYPYQISHTNPKYRYTRLRKDKKGIEERTLNDGHTFRICKNIE